MVRLTFELKIILHEMKSESIEYRIGYLFPHYNT